jgi:hypothetical protein
MILRSCHGDGDGSGDGDGDGDGKSNHIAAIDCDPLLWEMRHTISISTVNKVRKQA